MRVLTKIQVTYSGRLVLLAATSSLFAIFLTFFLLSIDIPLKDDIFLVKITSSIKRLVSGSNSTVNLRQFLFINVSYDNSLTDQYDEDGFVIGNTPIVDRGKLARLLDRINICPEAGPRYILCDIFFESRSNDDSLLQAALNKTKNIIIPYHFSDDYQKLSPVLYANSGFADYPGIDNAFYKFHLSFHGEMQSLPLKMYEDIYGKKFKDGIFISSVNSSFLLNSVIIDFPVVLKKDNASDPNANVPMVNLGDLELIPDTTLFAAVKDRILIIGDFRERDLHNTSIGTMAGPLILLNVFLTLRQEYAFIPFMFFVFLFSVYFVISYFIFARKKITDYKIIDRVRMSRFGPFLAKLFQYVFILIVISLISYFLFHIHLNILLLGAYFKAIESVTTYSVKRKSIDEGKTDV